MSTEPDFQMMYRSLLNNENTKKQLRMVEESQTNEREEFVKNQEKKFRSTIHYLYKKEISEKENREKEEARKLQEEAAAFMKEEEEKKNAEKNSKEMATLQRLLELAAQTKNTN